MGTPIDLLLEGKEAFSFNNAYRSEHGEVSKSTHLKLHWTSFDFGVFNAFSEDSVKKYAVGNETDVTSRGMRVFENKNDLFTSTKNVVTMVSCDDASA